MIPISCEFDTPPFSQGGSVVANVKESGRE